MILPKGIPIQDKTDRFISLIEVVSDALDCSVLWNCSWSIEGLISNTSESTDKVCPLGSLFLDSNRWMVLKDRPVFLASSNCV